MIVFHLEIKLRRIDILTLLIAQICGHITSLHLFRSNSVPLSNTLGFSVWWSCRIILNSFLSIYFYVIEIFHILFSKFSLPVGSNTIDFYIFTLYPGTLLTSLINLTLLSVVTLGSSMHRRDICE